jgi:hypothetical protein
MKPRIGDWFSPPLTGLSDVPVERDTVGGMSVTCTYPDLFKPYVYRGTGEDQFPETPYPGASTSPKKTKRKTRRRTYRPPAPKRPGHGLRVRRARHPRYRLYAPRRRPVSVSPVWMFRPTPPHRKKPWKTWSNPLSLADIDALLDD